jgi:hypothetical protein
VNKIEPPPPCLVAAIGRFRGRVENEYVGPAKGMHRILDPAQIAGGIADVRSVADYRTPHFAKIRHCFVDIAGRSRSDGHVRSFCKKLFRHRQPQSAGAAGNECTLSHEH